VDFAAALQDVVTQLKAAPPAGAGVETASTDPAEVLAPGVLVQLSQLRHETMGGWALDLNLILVAADTDGGRGPADQLTELLNLILAWAQPDGPVQARSIQLPSGPAPLPGLVFPITVRTDA
jgi:hypothetical protein